MTIKLVLRRSVILAVIVGGCAPVPSVRETKVAVVGVAPILLAEQATDGVCETPIRLESVHCPAVNEKRAWVSDDGADAACRLSVCGEERVWRRKAGRWQDATARLR
jgi:hypothetical protein